VEWGETLIDDIDLAAERATKRRVAVLVSGRGSNMDALIAAANRPDYPARIALVVSNRPDAGALPKAEAAGIPTVVIDHAQFAHRMAFEARLHAALLEHEIELVALAGFMRLLTGGFVDRWRDRLINIHPSLLPSFPGLDTHARALREGVRIHGCSVHFVRVDMDSGPIIAQAAVPVLTTDTPESLGARVLAAEHRLYPHALALVASGRVGVVEETLVEAVPIEAVEPALYSPALPTA
jgi:phosphoribosylglycinamide formyltransferase-1